jgi:membrane protein
VKNAFALFKEAWKEFGDDKAQRLGAALSYYTIFSIAPLLLIAIAIAGLVFGREAAQHQLSHQLSTVMGPTTSHAVEEMIKNAAKPKSGTFATIIGVFTLFLGAAGVFGQLKDALNTIWNVESKPAGGIWGFVRQRFLSVAMVMGVVFLLLVSLIFDTVLAVMGSWISARFPGGESLLHIVGLVISFALITVLFAMIFRYLPDTRVEWRDVWFGAAFTSFLFALGKFGLGLYLGKGSVGSAYGAAGSLVIILVWVYWSAQILFFGAEFTQVYARRHGSKRAEIAPHPAVGQPLRARRGEGAGDRDAIGVVAGVFISAIIGWTRALKSVKMR